MQLRDLIAREIQIPPLSSSRVHVWKVRSTIPAEAIAKLGDVLSPDEQDHANKFHFDRDRRSFTVCRATLRLLLGAYQNMDPRSIRFDYGAQGKPATSSSAANKIHFNVSHSGDICLLAFAFGRDVGVDVEASREGVNFMELAASVFSPVECAAVAALPEARRADLFYEYWSCKEACIKADGRGLSVPLQAFSIVPFEGRSQWRKIACSDPPPLAPQMRIYILPVGAGYAAAVAVNGEDWDVQDVYDVA